MNKLSFLTLKKVYWITAFSVISTLNAGFLIFCHEIKNTKLMIIPFVTILLVILELLFLHYIIYQKLTAFCQHLCNYMDHIMNGDLNTITHIEEDTLFSHIEHKLIRLYEILTSARSQALEEHKKIQDLISDISHQAKSPITNLRLLTAYLADNPQQQTAAQIENEVTKLDFLIQSMIKTSRLDTNITILLPVNAKIQDTILAAVESILIQADKKEIEITLDCDKDLTAIHDSKWTREAIYNILDNAVKYMAPKGQIDIQVKRQEIYTKIDISDTGCGISSDSLSKIFNRFYREPSVQNQSGIGLGLYLTQKILNLQNGYVTVTSQKGIGSTFHIFLLNS